MNGRSTSISINRFESKNADRFAPLLLALALLIASLPLPTRAQATPDQPGDSRYTLELEPFAQHTGENAIDLTHAVDGTSRVFVSTQSGQVFAFDRDGKSLGVFLDIAKARPDFTRTDGSFNGLMYIAFHPEYAKPDAPGFGTFYTNHQVSLSDQPADFDSKPLGANGDSDVRFVIAQWQVDPDNPERIDPDSYRQIMLINFHTTGSNPHAVGELAFNPYTQPGDADYGLLYIAVGDSNNRNESGHTNLTYVQQTDNPYAKILRIDPLGDGDLPYTIPADNPFAIDHVIEEADDSAPRTEAFAIGLRNSQSFTFANDLEGNAFIVAFDMGAATAEEINFVRAGRNYGWDRFEGTGPYTADRELFSPARPPVALYGHAFPTRPGEDPSGGPAAIVGGFVVSDPDDPAFQGQIVFADLPRGTLMHANLHHALTAERIGQQSRPYVMNVKLGDKLGTFADVIGADRADVRFGVDEAGRLYLVSKQTGTIFKTKLIYTGQPVQADPRLDNRTGQTNWALIAIAGVTVFLGFELLLVWRRAKRDADS